MYTVSSSGLAVLHLGHSNYVMLTQVRLPVGARRIFFQGGQIGGRDESPQYGVQGWIHGGDDDWL